MLAAFTKCYRKKQVKSSRTWRINFRLSGHKLSFSCKSCLPIVASFCRALAWGLSPLGRCTLRRCVASPARLVFLTFVQSRRIRSDHSGDVPEITYHFFRCNASITGLPHFTIGGISRCASSVA